ncbi:L,D-peptidoglycan transpeptidase YkuD (ErfK/YbiS/YcfS/YnhG family) [Flavobacterium sp. CG_23.5]|uniref:L,D-transpeptidase family protein n=1 Tax=Flavobacterium sp. CG_23.5 TaxID=2760708 RepID=UPI001AEB9F50|nr:L,D-transpeptidase family protein [Flavobacterium sp. CG_23.5]MBP2282417.1 L,D-peptidoglycan transpeptidase YkuD (ErfK/YbiS/YcfS/YnhG family) [Flavobacterium sp. CG_23.5]
MKVLNRFLFLPAVLFFCNSLQAQTKNSTVKNALLIAEQNKSKLENSEQLLVVYNYQPESYSAFFVALERKEGYWMVKYDPVQVGIGKNGFASPLSKLEGDGKSPTGIFRLGKLFTYEKQFGTLLENQQTTKDDKWIDDPNSDDYNRYVRGSTDAKSYENLLLNNDAYKYCMVIEYNTNPVVKGKGSAIFLHLGVKKPYFTAGCVAINEENMKLIVNWLDPKLNPIIIMGNFNDLKNGL